MNDQLGPGASIGQEPEREAETIPRGVKPEDGRVAANASQVGVPGEPGMPDGPSPDEMTEFERHRQAGQSR